MKTINPIRIEAKAKELMLNSVKRAIDNATINCSIVRLIVGAVDCLVYPYDNFNTVVHHVKLQSIILRLKELEAK